jgi:predicted AlkP superfamily phosphohydrolase/phosphomutase
MNNKKVLVIGIDGATFDLVEPWAKEGKLPVIAEIMSNGTSGELQSTTPAHSAPAWSSLITGKNPGKHGIFDFTEHQFGSYQIRFVNASHRSGRSIWRILSDRGEKVGVVHVPITYPPETVNGFMIAGMDSPGVTSNFTYPQDLYQEIKHTVGEYIIEPDLWALISRGKIEHAVKKLHIAIDRRFTAASYLLEKYPVDFFMIVFTETDRAQHAFWKYMDPRHPLYSIEDAKKYGSVILNIYQKVDDVIGKLLHKMGDDTITIIMSDHGAGYIPHKTLYLNNWLRGKGLLQYKDADVSGTKVFSPIKKVLYTKISSKLPRMLWQRIPKNIKYQLKRFNWFPEFRGRMASQFFYSRIDMNHTKAYAEESRGFIWINLKGRDPMGMVEPGEEYKELCNYIQNELHALRDPDTQNQIVARVYRKDEIYHGSNLHKAPDLVLSFKDGDYALRPSYNVDEGTTIKFHNKTQLEKMEINIQSNSRHLPNGIFILKGKEVKKGVKINGVEIIDLVPTILYVMGLAVPEDMDGKILLDCFQPDFVANNPVKFSHGEDIPTDISSGEYSQEDSEIVKERLSNLGYLD